MGLPAAERRQPGRPSLEYQPVGLIIRHARLHIPSFRWTHIEEQTDKRTAISSQPRSAVGKNQFDLIEQKNGRRVSLNAVGLLGTGCGVRCDDRLPQNHRRRGGPDVLPRVRQFRYETVFSISTHRPARLLPCQQQSIRHHGTLAL